MNAMVTTQNIMLTYLDTDFVKSSRATRTVNVILLRTQFSQTDAALCGIPALVLVWLSGKVLWAVCIKVAKILEGIA